MVAVDEVPAAVDLVKTIEAKTAESRTELEWAGALVINTPEVYAEAGERLKGVKDLAAKIVEFFAPMKSKTAESKKAATAAHAAVCAQESATLVPVSNAEAILKDKILGFIESQRKAAEERQRALQAAADAEAAKARAVAEAAAAKAKKPETKEKYLAAAAAIPAAPVIRVESAAPVISGIVPKTTWVGEVTDMKTFLAYVVEKDRADLVLVNQKSIDTYAKSMAAAAAMPGVTFKAVTSISAGRK